MSPWHATRRDETNSSGSRQAGEISQQPDGIAPGPRQPLARRRPWRLAFVIGGLALLLLLPPLLADGLHEAVGDAGTFFVRYLPRLGPAASFVVLYLEESGVPLPAPGDAFVVYLGHHLAGSPLALVGAWLGLIAVVVAGSTNLYLIARRWGRPLVMGGLGPFLHVTPDRLARVERWFDRWGALAIIFGRHIFGFRVPVTVAAGVFGVPYRVFILSVAISTAPWAAAWLWVGVTFGARLARFLHLHWWSYLVFPLALVLLFGMGLYRSWRHRPA
jgi:membrane protein DedA with SNARE-associated domain